MAGEARIPRLSVVGSVKSSVYPSEAVVPVLLADFVASENAVTVSQDRILSLDARVGPIRKLVTSAVP